MSFFVARGGGRFEATEHTSGPWDARAQHAGPPTALVVRELERTAPRAGMRLARVTVEILGPIPVAELEVETSVEREGRSVELLAAEMRSERGAVLRARAWRVLEAAAPSTEGSAPPPLPPREDGSPDFGYGKAIEWRFAVGGWNDPGPAAVWTRLRMPVVDGEEPSPLQRVAVVADSGNGISTALDWRRWLFINPELTLHALRDAEGEWVCLDAATHIGATGVARSVLSDRSGPVAFGAQALLVAPRPEPGPA
jgi:hypothetical protein